MNQDDLSNLLTADELLHMAIEASNRERYDLSIAYLKQAMAKPEPLRHEIPFMLASQYAQIGMKAEAKQYFAQTIALAPQFDIAIFQLGLLQLFDADQAGAELTFQQLDFLPAEHAINQFRVGMLALGRNELAVAGAALRAGLATGLANAPLMAEMQRILGNIEKLQADAASAPAEAPVAATDANANTDTAPTEDHIFLSAYRE